MGGDRQGDAARVTVDGVVQNDRAIPLVDDHLEHQVEARVPAV
jgi:hypothetical protein